ncbi:MAG: hypothetical protein WC455_23835 [Dehalococcoidia bacterium]|jgi:hypothetical protein
MEISEALERIRILAPRCADHELAEAALKIKEAYEHDEASLTRIMDSLARLNASLKQ